MGTTLTITAKGQVTLRKDVLRHLGVKPGEKVVVDFLPDSRAELRAAKSPATIGGFVGCLRQPGSRTRVFGARDPGSKSRALLFPISTSSAFLRPSSDVPSLVRRLRVGFARSVVAGLDDQLQQRAESPALALVLREAIVDDPCRREEIAG